MSATRRRVFLCDPGVAAKRFAVWPPFLEGRTGNIISRVRMSERESARLLLKLVEIETRFETSLEPNEDNTLGKEQNILILRAVAQALAFGYKAGIHIDATLGSNWLLAHVDLPNAGGVAWHLPACPPSSESPRYAHGRIAEKGPRIQEYARLHGAQ